MLFLIVAALAAEPKCQVVSLVQDDARAVERRGWVNGKPPTGETVEIEGFGSIAMDAGPHAPDVAAVDRAMGGIRTKEYAPLTIDVRRGSGCLDFGDTRAFQVAYRQANIKDPFLVVTINGTLATDEYGGSLFSTVSTDFSVKGIKSGDVVEVLVVTEGWQTIPRCRGIPTMSAETVCDRGYLLWERRAYVY